MANLESCITKFTVVGDKELANLPSFTVIKIPDQKLVECLSPNDLFNVIESKSFSIEDLEEGAKDSRLQLYGEDGRPLDLDDSERIPIFKLPNSGIHIITLPTLLLRYRMFLLKKLGKRKVGTRFGISRTHGSEEMLYTPIPISDIGSQVILSSPLEKDFSKYVIDDSSPVWEQERLKHFNHLPVPTHVQFNFGGGVHEGVITSFFESTKDKHITFEIDTYEVVTKRRITGTENLSDITLEELKSRHFYEDDISIDKKIDVIFKLMNVGNTDAIYVKNDDELVAILTNPRVSATDERDDIIGEILGCKRVRTMNIDPHNVEQFFDDDVYFAAFSRIPNIFDYMVHGDIKYVVHLLQLYLMELQIFINSNNTYYTYTVYSEEELDKIIERIKASTTMKIHVLFILKEYKNKPQKLSNLMAYIANNLTHADLVEEKLSETRIADTAGMLILRDDFMNSVLTDIFHEHHSSEFYKEFFLEIKKYSSISLGIYPRVIFWLSKIGGINLINSVPDSEFPLYLRAIFSGDSNIFHNSAERETIRPYIENNYSGIVKELLISKVATSIIGNESLLKLIFLQHEKVPLKFLISVLKELEKNKLGKEMVCKLTQREREEFGPEVTKELGEICMIERARRRSSVPILPSQVPR
jgi:hypothetical protein